MATEKKSPEVRFAGFNEDWEESIFQNVFIGLSNNSLSREKLQSDTGKAKNIHYGDILVKYGNIVDVQNENIPYIIEIENINKQIKSALIDGDVIFADAAEDETVGKCIELVNISNDIVLAGLHTIAVRPQIDFASKYLGYFLNSEPYHNQLLRLMQGTKVLSISKNSIRDTVVYYPKKQVEQKLIATYLSKIDELITNHQTQLAKLKNLKKAMLTKMFPQKGASVPEIRFKGFDGEWVNSSLDDEVYFYPGLTYSPADVNSKANVLVLRSSNVKQDKIIDADNVYVDSSVVNCTYVEVGDIVVVVRNGSRNLIGKHAQVKREMTNTVIGAFITGIRYKVPSFLNALLSTSLFQKQVEENLGATINQITTGVFKSMLFAFPKEAEQEKIGEYFNSLDDLIDNHNEQLKKLNIIKKACLSKLFVA